MYKRQETDRVDLRELASFAAFGRYGDESWLEVEATQENVQHWIMRVEHFLALFS